MTNVALHGNTTQKQVYLWWSPDGLTMVPVSATNPLPVTGGGGGGGGTSSFYGAAFPSSGTAIGFEDVDGNMSPGLLTAAGRIEVESTLVAGSALIGHVILDTGSTTTVTQTTASNLNATVVGTGTFATQASQSGTWDIRNVTGTVSLPTGASTAAKQPALGTAGSASTDVLTIQGIASMTKLLVTPDSVALPANQSVNVAQINGITPLMGNGVTGTGSPRVTPASDSTGIANWGHGATASAVPSGATLKGARGATANPTAVTDGQMVALMADKLGRQVVVMNGIRDQVSDQKTSLSNTTSETTIVTAAASIFNDLTALVFANTGATATKVDVRDTTGGSIRWTIYVPAGDTRGIVFQTPLKQATVNTNWTAQCAAATTAMEVSAQFVKNI